MVCGAPLAPTRVMREPLPQALHGSVVGVPCPVTPVVPTPSPQRWHFVRLATSSMKTWTAAKVNFVHLAFSQRQAFAGSGCPQSQQRPSSRQRARSLLARSVRFFKWRFIIAMPLGDALYLCFACLPASLVSYFRRRVAADVLGCLALTPLPPPTPRRLPRRLLASGLASRRAGAALRS